METWRLEDMIKYKKALNILLEHTYSFGEESCALENVRGRVLAEDVKADRDYPPFNRAMMDGYAGRSEEVEKWGSEETKRFLVREVLYAGSAPKGKLESGEVYKIMTGAAVPDNADVVIRIEDAQHHEDGTVSFLIDNFKPYQHIARKGEDIRQGEVLIPANTYCDEGIVALLAATGKLTVMVKRNPSVSIITSGNEVKPVDYPVNDVEIRNSNRYQLIASLQKMGINEISSFHANDSVDDLTETFSRSWDADIIISCGAVSMGDADHIPEVLASLGATCLFHKVAIRPGKPIWCGVRPNGKVIFALPGNPFSTRVNTRIFIVPYIKACMGISDSVMHFTFEGSRTKKTSLDEFFPANINESGKIEAISFNSSGDIRAGANAMGIAMHPYDKMEIKRGDTLRFYFF